MLYTQMYIDIPIQLFFMISKNFHHMFNLTIFSQTMYEFGFLFVYVCDPVRYVINFSYGDTFFLTLNIILNLYNGKGDTFPKKKKNVNTFVFWASRERYKFHLHNTRTTLFGVVKLCVCCLVHVCACVCVWGRTNTSTKIGEGRDWFAKMSEKK